MTKGPKTSLAVISLLFEIPKEPEGPKISPERLSDYLPKHCGITEVAYHQCCIS